MTDDPKAWCFDPGLGIMQDIGGYTEKAARNRLGRLGKQYGYKALREALRRIRSNKPREPMSYLTAVLKRLENEETGSASVVPQYTLADSFEDWNRNHKRATAEDFERLKHLLKTGQ